MKSKKNLPRYRIGGQGILGRDGYRCTALNQTLKRLLGDLELEQRDRRWTGGGSWKARELDVRLTMGFKAVEHF